MKSKYNKPNSKPVSIYPILMECIGARTGDFVVLFIAERKGTVVQVEGDAPYSLGEYASDWTSATHSTTWKPITGSITLEN